MISLGQKAHILPIEVLNAFFAQTNRIQIDKQLVFHKRRLHLQVFGTFQSHAHYDTPLTYSDKAKKKRFRYVRVSRRRSPFCNTISEESMHL